MAATGPVGPVRVTSFVVIVVGSSVRLNVAVIDGVWPTPLAPAVGVRDVTPSTGAASVVKLQVRGDPRVVPHGVPTLPSTLTV